MSFLDGILSVGKSAAGFLTGSGILSGLARTAILGYAVNRLSQNAIKGNDTTNDANIDKGVRLQISPNAESKIPVLYGSAFFGGNISDAAMTNNNKTMWYCLVLSEKTGNLYSTGSASSYTFENIYWNDQRIVFNSDGITANYTVDRSGNIDRSISGLVRVYCYRGGYNQGIVPDGYTGTVPAATSLFPNWNSSTHAMNGLIFALVRVDYNREKNVTGIGNMLFHVTNSMNLPGDALYDYLTNSTYGAGISGANILDNDISSLNTYAAQSVAYDDEGTGAQTLADRYQINGLIDTKKPVLENAESILSAAASWLSYDSHSGMWGVVINKAESSAASFNDSNILGSISVGGTGLQDLYNSVKVEFPHRDLRDSADFVKIEISSLDRNSNEEDNTLNINYDIINEPIQAQLLGFIELKQSRVDKLIKFQTDFGYYNLKAGDVIDVSNDKFGFTSKLFRIITINEVQDDGGALLMDITALEYDSNVYSTDDLYRYTRSDVNGIITIGSIGVPGTPIVTKVEVDARPRVIIETTAPTGVVEGIEFWMTLDVGESSDSSRSYTLIATKKPAGGGVYSSGTVVGLDYDQLGATNFYIKTRGFNATSVGQYSDPSGLVEFEPTQVTNAIDANTQAFDSTGGLLGALAVVELLGKLSDLFPSGEGNKSLFDRIFEVFNEETGVDLVGQASGGDLVVSSDLEILSDGTSLGTTTSSIDFAQPLEATGSGSITAKLIDGENNKDILAWDAEQGKWRTISGCISCDFPTDPPPPTPAVPCSLTLSSTLPPARGAWSGECDPITTVPYVGSYFITFSINPGSAEGGAANPAIPFYAPLQIGSGNVKLYGTDGELEQTLSASQLVVHNNVLELPFGDRVPGKDYYILFDEGIVTSCSCENAELANPTWAFTTSIIERDPYSIPADGGLTNPPAQSAFPATLRLTGYSPSGGGKCLGSNTLSLTYSEAIKAGSGFVTIKERMSGTTVTTLSISAATISGSTASWSSSISGLSANKSYDVTVPAGLVLTNRTSSTQTLCDTTVTYPAGPEVSSDAGSFGFSTVESLELVDYHFCEEASKRAAPNCNIVLVFNKSIEIKAEAPANVYIYEADGSLHQKINLRGTFVNNLYGNVYLVSGNTLSINPTKPFKGGVSYYLNIDAGVVIDAGCNAEWEGISDTTTVAWATDGIETTPPQGPTFASVKLYFQFGRPTVPGEGKINVIESNTGELLAQFGCNHPAVTFSETPFTS